MDSNKSAKPRRRVSQQKYAPSGAPLHLSALPRFHPATYAATHSSMHSSNASSLATTPGGSTSSSSGGATPRYGNPAPLSPSTQQRVFEAQRQLSYYQQHMIAQYAGSREGAGQMSGGSGDGSGWQKPDSPKLGPTMAGAGPVTPLELEDGERSDYLGGPVAAVAATKGSGMDGLREEVKKRRAGGDGSPRRKA